ncbi:hypothetical protein BC833DRAFT_625745 [Globomyces pollinis-pini]|nr:hypothetical protein BC833DRAFT_625745 [Globomyces pollinis-pini]
MSTVGAWDTLDDATWRCSALFVFYWLVSLSLETYCRFKLDLMWISVAISIPLNAVKMIIVMIYSEKLLINDIDGAYSTLWWYYIVNIFVYYAQHIAMYQRKKLIRPESYYVDELILLILSITTTVGNVLCLLNVRKCWAESSNTIVAALVISFVYFDIYYCLKVLAVYNNDQVSPRKRLLVIIPAWWTISNTFVYGYGSIVYAHGMADFYTNALWNLASLLIPIVAIQSNIATNVTNFVRDQSSSNQPTSSSLAKSASKSAKSKKSAAATSPTVPTQ